MDLFRFKRIARDKGVAHDGRFFWFWLMHFGNAEPGTVTCRDCEDFQHGWCSGGREPVSCMAERSQRAIFHFGGVFADGDE